jgi:hypothetical protein
MLVLHPVRFPMYQLPAESLSKKRISMPLKFNHFFFFFSGKALNTTKKSNIHRMA